MWRNNLKLWVMPEAHQRLMMAMTMYVALLKAIQTWPMVTKTARCDGDIAFKM
jgi:hypothetical protein